ncbi:hypothetical protein ILYODFUR_021173 [Ilyodon furcidens]|uniref:Uncharacterized protein n=1 Tax=Ilyodon furcidens TaxID=33524 RepID=A0ABV0SN47_9TELE
MASLVLTVSKTNDGSSASLTSPTADKAHVPPPSLLQARNIQVYKTGAKLKADRNKQRESKCVKRWYNGPAPTCFS